MKPTKNRVFCPAYKHYKMLFDSKSKAMNFIRFNANDVAVESGVKPVRAFYCTACGGWHVTSSPLAKTHDMMVRRCLRIVRHAEFENDTLHAKRFLCWAERYASNMDSDDRRAGLLNEIKKQSSGLSNTLRIRQNEQSRMPENQLCAG